MIKECIIKFEVNHPICKWDDSSLKQLQKVCYESISKHDNFDFVIENGELFMTHIGGVRAAYWDCSKNRILGILIHALIDLPLKFKRNKRTGNFIYVP